MQLVSVLLTASYLLPRLAPPLGTTGAGRRACAYCMAEEKEKEGAGPGGMGGLGAPSFEEFKKMMERDVSPDQLSVSEQVGRGVSKSWANPAYWSRQFVTAQHIANNVANNSKVLELGKDAKNLYYINSPGACTLIVPPSNFDVKEGPIREAAVKLNVPFTLFTDQALDTVPIVPNSFDAALCFDMLDTAPENAVQGAVSLLGAGLKPSGRLLFLEKESVGLPAIAREFGFSVQSEVEGGYDVGIATKRVVGKGDKRKDAPKKKQAVAVDPSKGGFGASAGKKAKPTAAEKEARKAQKADAAAKAKAAREAAAEEAAAAEAAAAARAAEEAAAAAAAQAAAAKAAEEAAAAKAAEEAAAAAAAAQAAAAKAVEEAAAVKAAEEAVAAAKAAEDAAAEEAAAVAAAAVAAAAAAQEAASVEAAAAAQAAAQQQQQAASAQQAAAAQAIAAQESVALESEVRVLISKDLSGGDKLDSAEDARLEALWKAYPELCDRIDDEVTEEAEEGEEEGVVADGQVATGTGTSTGTGAPTASPAADGEYAEVACPAELGAARTMRIAMPDGREFDVQVPEGVQAGETFVVGPFPAAA